MARSAAVVGLLLAAAAFGSCFLGGVPTQPPRAPTTQNHVDSLGAAPVQSESSESYSWAAPLLSFGAALGVIFGLVAAQPAKAITAEQFSQLTYAQVRGSGLANRCPTVESNGTEVPVKAGSKMINVCFEPKSFAVEIDTDNGKEFATTKLTTRQTYTLAFIEGNLDPNPITFKEQDGMDFAATTVKLPDGEYVPFLFTVKELVAKGEGSSFKPGFTWGGEFSVPSYRTGGFLDPKARGMNLGYDQAVALPAMQADGKSGQEDIFKETNKVFDVGRGAIEMEVNKAGPLFAGVHRVWHQSYFCCLCQSFRVFQFFRWKIIHLHFACTYASMRILLTPLGEPRVGRDWRCLCLQATFRHRHGRQRAKDWRVGRFGGMWIYISEICCWSLQRPAASKQVVRRHLDPNNIPSKHWTSGGIWKTRRYATDTSLKVFNMFQVYYTSSRSPKAWDSE